MQTRSIGHSTSRSSASVQQLRGRLDEAGPRGDRRCHRQGSPSRHRRHLRRRRSEELVGKALGTSATRSSSPPSSASPTRTRGGAAAGYVARAVEDSLRASGPTASTSTSSTPRLGGPRRRDARALNDLVVPARCGDRVLQLHRRPAARGRVGGRQGARFESVQNQMSVLSREAEDTSSPSATSSRSPFCPSTRS